MNLAKLLVREGIVSAAQVKECMDTFMDSEQGVSESLVALGYAEENEIVDCLSGKFGVPAMDIDGCEADESLLGLVPAETAIEKFLVPIGIEGPDLMIAVSDPSNILMLDDLGFITGKNIKPVVASERSIREKLAKYYGAPAAAASAPDSQGSADSSYSGTLVKDSPHSSIMSAQAEEIIKELEQYEKGLSSLGNRVSGAQATEETRPPQLLDITGHEQTGHEKNVFDLGSESGVHDGSPLSDSSGENDSNVPDEKDNGAAVFEKEEEKPGVSASPPDDSRAVQEEESEPAPQSDARKPQGPDIMNEGKGRTVLIVDVSPTVRKIMSMTLARAGYRVSAAGDGMQALASLNETIPDLVFIDIKLPHMDGYQLCKVIKSHGLTKSVPVILVTGKTGVLDKMKVKMAGASDMITKPFAAGVLVETAGKHASRSQSVQ